VCFVTERTQTGDTVGGVLVGTVPVERCPVVSAAREQPAVQPIRSRGSHTERQGQPSGGRHTHAERDAAQVPHHQRRPGRVRVHEGHRVVQSR